MQIVLLIGMLAFVYLVFLRPQQKRVNQQRNLVNSVEVGDEVATIGGMVGKVVTLDEEYMILEVSSKINIKFLKIALNKKLSSPQDFPVDGSNPDSEPKDEVIEATFDDDEKDNTEVELNTKDEEIVDHDPTIIHPDHKEP